MTHEKNWGKYDQPTCQAIMRELPKTWSELWESPTIRMRIKSRRTLTEYLRHLKKTGAVKRVIDEEKNKIVYTPKDRIGITNLKQPRAEWVSFLRMRRRGYDLEELYWGGQELGLERWWEQAKVRSKKAHSALSSSVNMWFKDKYGEKFTKDGIGTVFREMTDLLVHNWLDVAELYLTMLFGKEMIVDRHAPRVETLPEGLQNELIKNKLSWWYTSDPEAAIWEQVREFLALVVLAIKAGYCSTRDVSSVLADIHGEIFGRGLAAKGMPKGIPIDSLADGELYDLIEALRGEDPTKKDKAEKILGLHANDS